jgi:hypothetical protein
VLCVDATRMIDLHIIESCMISRMRELANCLSQSQFTFKGPRTIYSFSSSGSTVGFRVTIGSFFFF